MKLKRIGYFNEVEDLKMFADASANEIVYGKKGNFISVDDDYIYDSEEALLSEITLEFTKDNLFAVHSDLPIDLNLLGQPNVCDFFIDVYEAIEEDEDEVKSELTIENKKQDNMKIYYIYPDYLEDWCDETHCDTLVSEDLCRKFVREGKADVYGPTTFEDAFNNSHISDIGMIKIFKGTTPNF